MAEESSPSPANKRAKTIDLDEVCKDAFAGFRSFLDSCVPENPEGDFDELLNILQLLRDSKFTGSFDIIDNPKSLVDLLPALQSVVATLVADELMAQYLCMPADDENEEREQLDVQIRLMLQTALDCMPINALVMNICANTARMTQSLPLASVARLYMFAADCASDVRVRAMDWLDDDSSIKNDSVKEWIEILLLQQVTGVQWMGGADKDEDESNGDEADANSEPHDKPNGNKEEVKESADEDAEDEEEEYWSSSIVESTARFMAATLLSMFNEHELARHQLQVFDLTHRLHPNVWKGATKFSDVKLSPVDPNQLEPALFPKNVLPDKLYQRLCKVFAHDAPYWKESSYEQRGYYSYYSDLPESDDAQPSNLIENIICTEILPLVQQRLSQEQADSIVGYEWWVHTRPIQANLGHNLHFDTDESMLRQSQKVTHPIFSSVLYLTGGAKSGATIVLDQTPDSDSLPEKCWYQKASDNSMLLFPGNLLHGVMPCPGNLDATSLANNGSMVQGRRPNLSEWLEKPLTRSGKVEEHRLTFMVGFWTRRVPDTMESQSLYGPCGPLPPNTPEHSWVEQICEGYNDGNELPAEAIRRRIQPLPVPQISPVWEALTCQPFDPPLVFPRMMNHRFFVKDAPKCFHDSLFERDESDEEDGDDGHYHVHDHHHDHDHDGGCGCQESL
ncbi:hypothetical protein MPSEU_000929700 [Mayamaea pseudoterrestris]|nr:hypothetical protein MPSEU_000929700 [Mayamaea pseudoterrestris]